MLKVGDDGNASLQQKAFTCQTSTRGLEFGERQLSVCEAYMSIWRQIFSSLDTTQIQPELQPNPEPYISRSMPLHHFAQKQRWLTITPPHEDGV